MNYKMTQFIFWRHYVKKRQSFTRKTQCMTAAPSSHTKNYHVHIFKLGLWRTAVTVSLFACHRRSREVTQPRAGNKRNSIFPFFFFFLVWGSNQVYSFILMVILRIAGPCASWTYTLSLSYTLLPRKFCITLLSWPSFHTHFLCSSLETRWLKTHGSDAVACCESLLECPHTS